MSHQDELSQWTQTIVHRFPHLSGPQARVLALFSFGMVLCRACGISAVALTLSAVLCQSPNTVRQRLREFCYEAAHKRGTFREELDVTGCFAPLLSWVMALWQGKHLAMALDTTMLCDRFAVLCLSVLYKGCAIPVAWAVLPGNQKGAFKPHWLRLLRLLHRSVPKDISVLVLSDRGLYAKWLFHRIQRLGWHPVMRINANGAFRPQGAARSLPLRRFAPVEGTCWAGQGTAFSSPQRRLPCTLLARWDQGHQDPWLLLTDLAPASSDALWYGMRAWIEHGFKTTKSGGFGWHHTRMTDPGRAERLWLCVAVATLWLLSLGTQAEDALTTDALTTDALTTDALAGNPSRRTRSATHLRLFGLFRQGLALFLACLVCHKPLPQGFLRPDHWPKANLTTNHSPITYP